MAIATVRRLSLLCAALMSTTALTLVGTAQAQSKVGVTSATDGDPLGKPPSENERVLRIGIDVQANEVVTTHGNDRAHLVFLDGSSLTVGPNARLTIDKFVYDPNTKTGELAVTASQGVLRFVGGRISKTSPVTINTPSGTIGIRGGIGIFGVGSGKTTAAFLFGNSMTVTGQGQTQTMTRPSSFVIVNTGASPSLPSLLPPGGLNALIGALELANNNSGKGGSGGGNADQKAQGSGFSSNNSGQSPPGTLPGTANPPNTSNNAVTTAVQNSGGASNPQDNTTTTTTTTTTNTVPKTTQIQTGYVGGLIVASAGHHSVTAALSGAQPGDLTINTDADTSKVTAKIIIRGLDGSVYSPSATLHLGVQPNSSSFQDNANFFTGTSNGRATISAGEATIRARDTSVLWSAAQVPGGSYVGSNCTCDFLTFGEWETTISPGRHHHHGGPTAVVTQAPWVAGQVATQLPNTQSASFSGGMWGQAQNGNGPTRNVTGTFGMNYSWGPGTGTWNSQFDNRTYNGTVAGTGANFGSNNIAATTGTRTMSVNGSFMTGPGAGGGVVGVAGQFNAGGPGYQASGVFGGSKQ